MANIKIIESDRQISQKINNALAKELDRSMRKNSAKLKTRLQNIISSALWSSPEISSLSSGTLMADFGLTSDPSSAIVSSILSSVVVDVKRVKSSALSIDGGIILAIQPIDYSNLFSLSVSEQVIDGGSIPWLKWLLTLGDTIIIANFGVKYGPFGRTGKAHMTQTSRPFKVNSLFSGTADNNFITRALSNSSAQIKQAIRGAL
jgi:hypothetical protein|tara:strand:+ start:426 stop:1037 length:612 start_codon:yes stop_codon:yes gene_type:complete